MKTNEILELRKQFSPAANVITKICGCYVNGEKEILCKSKDAFYSLSEEEAFKYFDIFKHTLSGRLEKNLINLSLPSESVMEGGEANFLLKLRDSGLDDDELLDEFYSKIIDFYDYPSNYYIVLIGVTYDVPGKANDGTFMFDSSEEVYQYLLCSICPVNLAKAGLSYDYKSNNISERIRDWVVDLPINGFLYPAFTDRTTDIHNALFYAKKPAELQPEFINNIFGCNTPLSSVSQKSAFNCILAETLEDSADFETVVAIHDRLNSLIAEHKEEAEPFAMDKMEVKKILENSGADIEKMEAFDSRFDEFIGNDASLFADNITDVRALNVKAPNISIKVHPESTHQISTRVIDGRECIVIEVDDHVEINGVYVKTTAKPQ